MGAFDAPAHAEFGKTETETALESTAVGASSKETSERQTEKVKE